MIRALAGQHRLDLLVGKRGEHGQRAGADAQRVLQSGLQRVGADRIGAFLAVEAERKRVPGDGEEARVLALLRKTGQTRAADLEQSEPRRGKGAKHIGFLAEEVEPRVLLLLDKPAANERQQQPADGRLVEPALGHELGQRCPAPGMAADQRQERKRTIHALSPAQWCHQIPPKVHNMDLYHRSNNGDL